MARCSQGGGESGTAARRAHWGVLLVPSGGHTRCDLAVPCGSQGLLLILGLVLAGGNTDVGGKKGGQVGQGKVGSIRGWGAGNGLGGIGGRNSTFGALCVNYK